MASDVDICNLALGHFGQDALVATIDPPDGSAEAEHCARFYPIARDEMLESAVWSFATKRKALAAKTNDRTDWAYRFALPNDCLKPQRLLPEGYTDDIDDQVPFDVEGQDLYTDDASPTLVYTWKLTDATKFSPLFTSALSYLLASYVVGPITKDPTGRSQVALRQSAMRLMGQAAAGNANIARRVPTYTPTAKRVR